MASFGSVSVTYVPADCGSVIPGKSKAPQAFQDVKIISKLKTGGLDVVEQSALKSKALHTVAYKSDAGVRNEELNVGVCEQVYQAITKSLGDSEHFPFQLILGGECGMLPAIMSAFWRYGASRPRPLRVGLIYIDADTDLWAPSDPTSTGVFASMNMVHLAGLPGGLRSMKQFSRVSGAPVCDSTNTVLFGTNMAAIGNTRDHFAYLFDNKYKVITSTAVAQAPQTSAHEALKHIEDCSDVIMVHLDVDAIDPLMFPLANLPNYTDVTFSQMMAALRIFLSSMKVGGLSIAEVNPDHDPELSMVERLTNEIVDMLIARKVQN